MHSQRIYLSPPLVAAAAGSTAIPAAVQAHLMVATSASRVLASVLRKCALTLLHPGGKSARSTGTAKTKSKGLPAFSAGGQAGVPMDVDVLRRACIQRAGNVDEAPVCLTNSTPFVIRQFPHTTHSASALSAAGTVSVMGELSG